MNFFNRAIKNVTRKMSRSILLAITFFVIGNFVIVGLGVSQAADTAKTLTRQKMRAVVTYSVNYDEVWEYIDNIEDEDERNEFYEKYYPRITIADVESLIKDPRVKTANSLSTTMLYKTNDSEIDFVHLNNQAEENIDNNGGQSCYFNEDGTEECYTYVEPSFAVKSNYFPDMIEFSDGDFTLTDGRFYTQEEIDEYANVVLVTKAFADYNNLSVGDDITISLFNTSDLKYYENEGLKVSEEDLYGTFEIIGIYDTKNKITPDSSNYDYTWPYDNPDNLFLIPATSMFKNQLNFQQMSFDFYASKYPDDDYYQNQDNRPSLENMEKNSYIDSAILLLSDPLEVDEFCTDYKDSLPRFMKLDANNSEFKKLAKPLDTLNLYANFIVWLVVINAIVIITLVTALTLKTREYEIGVLLSIGASKLKIIAQFFIELALVAIIGFTLSVGSGSIIANKVGAIMLEYQIQENELDEEGYQYEEYYSVWNDDYTTEITLDDLIAEYNVTVSPIIIAEIYVLGLGIVFVSVIIPSIMIMRFNPKKILMNQN